MLTKGLFKKHSYRPVEGVSNIELFYDLIFVYCISVLTSLCHHVEGFLDLTAWVIFLFSYLAILQVWFFTTLLMNRFGERSATDCAFLFVNMFLLYFMASGVQTQWTDTRVTFNVSWTLILLNQALAWGLKAHTYDNLDEDDLRMIRHTVATLVVQASIAFAAALLPFTASVIASWIALLVGITVWGWSQAYRAKAARFSHVAERCSLLTIVAFGETVVALSSYTVQTSSIVYPAFVFALVVGLFLIYIFEHDNMLDHHAHTDGISYMTVTSWLIVVMGNLTVALEYMPMPEVDFVPKSIYLNACLVLYLLTSFAITRYNKPEYKVSGAYMAGRLAACALIVIVAAATSFDPLVTLIVDTFAVYMALAYEVVVYRRRSGLVAFGLALGYEPEDLAEEGLAFTTAEGRRAIEAAACEASKATTQGSRSRRV